jgi:pyrroloquinoline-quinone synthase
MEFWDRLSEVCERHDVLGHPFYVRWSAGELTRDELAIYAGQYRHAVVALAEGCARAAGVADAAVSAELAAHAAEEAAHVALWDGFARAVGVEGRREALPETAACARAWAGTDGRTLLDSLVALYAIESAQPAISESKRTGLRAHYGIVGPEATAYFDVHVERDVEHAASGRALIAGRLAGADEERLLAQAEAVLQANWTLLDGVERVCAGR